MLIPRPRERSNVGAAVLLALLLLGPAIACLSPMVRADVPGLVDNGDATRTLSWSLNTSDGFTIAGLELANGTATLPWRPANLTWDRPSRFEANVSGGVPDANLTFGVDGVSLRANTTNHVASADFATATPWTFESSPDGNVSAEWNASLQAADLGHASPSVETDWDSMDATTPWIGIGGPPWINRTHNREGSGMVGLNFSLGSSPVSFAGVQRSSPVDWSSHNRLVLWILLLDVSSPVTFNVTAFAGSSLRGTSQRSLTSGWQEVAVDLTELGPSRGSLVSATLRINGQDVNATTVYFDDLRLGNAKVFSQAASVQQTFVKTTATPDRMGSGSLRFNWSFSGAAGVVSATGTVEVSGPSGTSRYSLSRTGAGWSPFLADISANTALAGSYVLRFEVQVLVDNTSASAATLRVDDVSIRFPNRERGTYLSKAVPLGAASEFLTARWIVDSPRSTAVSLSLRSGNDSVPGSATWSNWHTWTVGGTYPAMLRSAAYVQVMAELQTGNASVSPSLRGMDLSARHRVASGTIMSGIVSITGPVSGWRALRAVGDVPARGSIAFSIGDGTFLQPVPSDGELRALSPQTTVRWSATLSTSDGLRTPMLDKVEFVYDTAVPPAFPPWVLALSSVMPYAIGVLASCGLGYIGYQFVTRRLFAIDDLFVISKDGRLLMHNTRRMRADRDEDIFSGMLTAILSFLRDSDREENGDLHRFQIGGKTTLLERGAHAYLVAVYSGRVPPWAGKDLSRFMQNLESTFGSALVRWTGDPEDLQGLKEFTKRFVSRTRYRPPRWPTRRSRPITAGRTPDKR